MKLATKVFVALGLVACTAATASAAVTINELKVKGTEFIELYNDGPAAVDVTGWSLDDGTGPEVLAGIIPAGGFFVVATTLSLNNSGAVVELFDAGGALIDDVGYGFSGGAPLGFNSIGRYPDGDDTDDWARDFEYCDDTMLAVHETPGAPNVQDEPKLGSSVLINEIKWQADNVADFDAIEIYNPTGAPVDLIEHWVSDGDGYCQILNSIVVPPGGYAVLTNGVAGEGMDCTGFDAIAISGSDVMYLYSNLVGQGGHPIRIDQLGIDINSPGAGLGTTYQRCVDGAGPNDGYDWPSSGGGLTYFQGASTLGASNNGLCGVQNQNSTWGRMKGLYR
jgi:hypothetical protein